MCLFKLALTPLSLFKISEVSLLILVQDQKFINQKKITEDF